MRHVLIYLNLVANWHFSRGRGLDISTKNELMRDGLQLCYVLKTTTIKQGLATEVTTTEKGPVPKAQGGGSTDFIQNIF